MGVRATNVIPAKAYDEARLVMVSVRRDAVRYRDQFQSEGGDSDTLLGVLAGLSSSRSRLMTLAATSGIGPYAAEQEDDPAYNAGQEFNGLLALMVSAGQEIIAVIPTQNPDDYLLTHTLDAQGFRVARQFTSADLQDVSTALDAIATFIE